MRFLSFAEKRNSGVRRKEAQPLVFLSIEHKEREFYPKVLLGITLLERGYRVVLGSSEAVYKLAVGSPPGIFLHKSPHPRSSQLKELGHKFVVLDEETGPSIPPSNKPSAVALTYRKSSTTNQDMILLYSQEYAELTAQLVQLEAIEQRVTGWPRFDLFKPKLRPLLARERQLIYDAYGDFILFPTSFGGSTPNRLQKVEQESLDVVSRRAANARRMAYSSYVEFVKEFSRILPRELRIVVRPHPSERESDWKKVFRHLENVLVTGDGDSTPWVLASRATVQMGSTLALSSIALEKPTYIIASCLDSDTRESLAARVCTPVHSPEELLESVFSSASKAEQTTVERAAQTFLRESKIVEPEFAVDLIADSLDSLKTSPQEPPEATLGIRVFCWLFLVGSALKAALAKLGFGQEEAKTVHEALRGRLTKEEVGQLADDLATCTSNDLQISVHEFAPNLLLLEAK